MLGFEPLLDLHARMHAFWALLIFGFLPNWRLLDLHARTHAFSALLIFDLPLVAGLDPFLATSSMLT